MFPNRNCAGKVIFSGKLGRVLISFSYRECDNFKVRKVLDPPES